MEADNSKKSVGVDDLIEALTIFRKYMNEYGLNFPTHCEHDILMVSVAEEELAPEDVKRLDELGFRYDSDYSVWASYRFGSS